MDRPKRKLPNDLVDSPEPPQRVRLKRRLGRGGHCVNEIVEDRDDVLALVTERRRNVLEG